MRQFARGKHETVAAKMTTILLLLWTLAVVGATVGGVIVKSGLTNQIAGLVYYGAGILMAAFCVAAVPTVVFADRLARPFVLAFMVFSTFGGIVYVVLADVRPVPKPQIEDLVAPAQIPGHKWHEWGLEPTIRDDRIVELHPRANARVVVWPVKVIPKLVDLEVLEYPDKGASDLAQFVSSLTKLRRGVFPRTGFSIVNTPIVIGMLASLPELEVLDLRGSNGLNRAAVEGLSKCKVLVELDLSDNRFLFEPAPLANGCPRLQFLNLSGTLVDDKQLLTLAGHPSLKRIDVGRTKVTAQGIAAARMRNAELQIVE